MMEPFIAFLDLTRAPLLPKAMGPLQVLLSLGANVIAVDLDRDAIWKRIIETARNSPGRLIFPVKVPPPQLTTDEQIFKSAGCNLFTDTPEIANWLSTLEPSKTFVIGSYAYLDGERHVRVSLAMDAIVDSVCRRRKTTTALAYLCSPTDVFVVDKATRDAAVTNYKKASVGVKLLAGLTRLFVKTVRGVWGWGGGRGGRRSKL